MLLRSIPSGSVRRAAPLSHLLSAAHAQMTFLPAIKCHFECFGALCSIHIAYCARAQLSSSAKSLTCCGGGRLPLHHDPCSGLIISWLQQGEHSTQAAPFHERTSSALQSELQCVGNRLGTGAQHAACILYISQLSSRRDVALLRLHTHGHYIARASALSIKTCCLVLFFS